jgi:hypothetical protein
VTPPTRHHSVVEKSHQRQVGLQSGFDLRAVRFASRVYYPIPDLVELFDIELGDRAFTCPLASEQRRESCVDERFEWHLVHSRDLLSGLQFIDEK